LTGRRRGRPASGDPDVVGSDVILDAALTRFAERGYEGTSMREIARSLGISHNLIPQRFGTKDEVWKRAVDHGFGRLAVAMAERLQTLPAASELEQLRATVTMFVELNARNPSLLRIIGREAVTPGPRFDHLFDNHIAPVRDFGADLLARLKDTGEVRTASVGLMYFFMTHGAGGPLALPALAERFGSSVDPDDDAAVRAHALAATDLLFDGLTSGR
jgi:AcrR family transcriptional regulator